MAIGITNQTFLLFLAFLQVWILQCCILPDRPSPKHIIKSRLQDTSETIRVASDTLYAQSLLRRLYQFSENQLIWRSYTTDDAEFADLIEIIESTAEDGLNPNDYHLKRLNEYLEKIKSIDAKDPDITSYIIDADFLLSDAFLTIAFHLEMGRVQGARMKDDSVYYFDEKNLPMLLWKASSTNNVKEALSTLHPPYLQYRKLRTLLRKSGKSTNTVVAPLTPGQKSKISLSLERWRWLPKLHNSIFLTVNIPAFRLTYHAQDSSSFNMKTIVGTLDNPTPVFNGEISHIILRPRWNVPSTILEEEILPRALVDSSYLTRNHFQILKTWQDDDTSFIDPKTILWDSITIATFPYRVVQTSGFWNPLGEIKFIFPNQYEVYLHDTPNHDLFDHEIRMFSHGCIRVEKAKDLAALLAQNDSLRHPHLFGENERWDLDIPVPIFINCWTAWYENEAVLFYNDIYGADSLLQLEMEKAPMTF